jgi:hypothetical protein
MSLRDLLSFNLFLQLTDGLVSYQSFVLGAVEANPVVAAAIIKWVWFGAGVQQDLGVPTVAAHLCLKTQQPFTYFGSWRNALHAAGIDPDLHLRHYKRRKRSVNSMPAARSALFQDPNSLRELENNAA